MAKYEAGFIGAGNMGGALALAAAKKTGGDRIAVACSTRERSEAAAQRLGCTAETPQRILSDSRFVFLGVKPQMVVGVVEGLKADILASEGIFVSMLAGVSLEKLALLLGALFLALNLLSGKLHTNSYLVVMRYTPEGESAVRSKLGTLGKYKLKSRTMNLAETELVVEAKLSQKQMDSLEALLDNEGVSDVNIVSYNGSTLL